MNKKMLFGLVGLIAGAGILRIIKHLNEKSAVNFSKEVENKISCKSIPIKYTSKINNVNLDEMRMDSANSIQDRHKVAAQVMKETVEKISENTKLTNNNDQDFDNMLDDLDILC